MSMDIKNGITHSHDVRVNKEYADWIVDIKKRYRNAQIKAAIRVNSEQLYFNWCLGRDLVLLRAEERWGKGVVEQVSLDLRAEFPNATGFSPRNLWFMKQWFLFYCSDAHFTNLSAQFKSGERKLKQVASQVERQKLKQVAAELPDSPVPQPRQGAKSAFVTKVQQTAGEFAFPSFFGLIPWMHHVVIIQKCKNVEEALFYIKKTIADNLSRSALENCIRADLYHTAGAAVTNFAETLPDAQGKLAQDLFKGNYDFGFVQLAEDHNEYELEDALEKRITRFLLELGQGWAFVGRQKELIISGKSRRIDLLFYHIRLRCYVVLELKAKPFEPEFAGKLNFYVNAIDAYLRDPSDNPTIGLLVCKGMDKTDVRLSFQGITTPMGVATYDNARAKEIAAHLPTAEELQAQISIAEKEYKRG